MSNTYFQFKQFRIEQARSAMKVTTDACLFGAWVAKKTSGLENVTTIVDAGTGTGLLSMMIAQKNLNVHVDAVEIDEDAAAEASGNVSHSIFSDRITVVRKDLREFHSGPYDVFVSNPPFFENDLHSHDERRNAALHATDLSISELINCIQQLLKAEGHLFILLAHRRMTEFEKIIQDTHLKIIEKVIVRQSVNHKPFRVMFHGTLTGKSMEPLQSEIFITDRDKKYSVEFTSLLQDYYLNL